MPPVAEACAKAIELPVKRPAAAGATWWQITRGRLRERVGALLSWVRIPGAISQATIDDPVTHQHIEVHVTALYTRLTVDGRDYYFDRLTGRYDGAGMGCPQPTR